MKNLILVTGCAGFIGCNFLKRIMCNESVKKEYDFLVLDSLTYAGHYPSISVDIERNSHIEFRKVDIRDEDKINHIFSERKIQGVINIAAESHVDRSIEGPNIFLETNVGGTLNLLNASLRYGDKTRFLQVSTDEVYGTLGLADPAFTEKTPIAPNSPYSASKASADLFVRSFNETYQLDTVITRCSNNYGPYQYPEKFIPLMVSRAIKEKTLPIYGKGINVRDWIYVDDHVDGIWQSYLQGESGEVYNFGGDSEMKNIDVAKQILKILGKSEDLFNFVQDRPGHDLRYAINFEKSKKQLGWAPSVTFEDGLKSTVDWYKSNHGWLEEVSRYQKECVG